VTLAKALASGPMRAIRISEWGGPEVLELDDDVPDPQPGENDVLVRVTRAGINFADTHARENTYLARYELPLVPGAEVAGVVEGDGHGFAAGQRVVSLVGTGGYAEYVAAPAATTFAIPDGVSDATALALLLQGLTAWHLYRTSAQLRPGESVVVHAAAGGVGSIAVQLGKPLGAGRVIATASSEEKRALALELGADAAVDVTRDDLTEALVEANLGERVDVVLEMAGGRVFDASLDALAPFGRLVTYGIASREPNTVSSGALMRKSRGVIGFWLMHCLRRPAELVDAPLQELFERAAAGELRVVEGGTYPLSEVRRAHEDLQARRTSGKLTLDPER
jgi:NADPH2:quinone reductase